MLSASASPSPSPSNSSSPLAINLSLSLSNSPPHSLSLPPAPSPLLFSPQLKMPKEHIFRPMMGVRVRESGRTFGPISALLGEDPILGITSINLLQEPEYATPIP